MDFMSKQPILLLRKHHVVELFFRREHTKNNNHGTENVTNIKTNFSIVEKKIASRLMRRNVSSAQKHWLQL